MSEHEKDAAPREVWKTALYLRLSKEDGDKEESDSITNQRELISAYLKSVPDTVIVSEWVDDGYSGADFRRPAFQAMMENIRAGLVDCVAVKDLSRFGRNFAETGKYLEHIFPFLGVRFISVNDAIDSESKQTRNDSIIIPFKNLVNDAYCRDISVKIRSQLAVKRQKGDFISPFAVYGYLKDEENHNRLIIDETAADTVRNIFKWKLDGLSQQGIADRLNEFGVFSPMEYKKSIGLNFSTSFKSHTRAKWSAVAVGRILRDEIYTGILAQGKTGTPNHKVKKNFQKPKEDWVRVADTHDPIISREEFLLVNGLLSRDTRVAPGREAVYLFSGFVRCSECNENMVRKTVTVGGKKYVYYVCGKGCDGGRISEKTLMESVSAALRGHIGNILNLEHILRFIETLPLKQEEVQKLDRQIAVKREEMQKYKRLGLSLYESFLDGVIDEQEYQSMKAEFSGLCAEAEQALSVLGGEIENILSNKGEKNVWIEHFKQYHNFSKLTRRMAVSLIDKIIVHNGGIIELCVKYAYNYNNAVSFVRAVNEIQPLQDISLLGEVV